jgi:hypothetical protein
MGGNVMAACLALAFGWAACLAFQLLWSAVLDFAGFQLGNELDPYGQAFGDLPGTAGGDELLFHARFNTEGGQR